MTPADIEKLRELAMKAIGKYITTNDIKTDPEAFEYLINSTPPTILILLSERAVLIEALEGS